MTVKDQDKELANDILKRNYYDNFKTHRGKTLEIYLSGKCKSNCKYCYLKKHQKEIYPIEFDNNDLIIKNFQILMNWYVENEFCNKLDFFSGEWLTTPLRDPIMQIMYDTFKDKDYNHKPDYILAADNMQFLRDDKCTQEIQNWIDKFAEIGITIPFSCSVDGKYCEQDRRLCDDEYYKKLFSFMEKNKLLAHPMVSSYNAKYWIDNYQWWQDNAPEYVAKKLMMLEVRDETWTEETISDLIHFLDFEIDYIYHNYFKEDKEDFLRFVLKMKTKRHLEFNDISYINISLPNSAIDLNSDVPSCSYSSSLCVRIGDLAIIPCHRQGYDELVFGHYNVVDNKIIDFEPKNVALMVMKDHIKKSTMPHCENCKFSGVCIGHCLGNSYEQYRNPLVPVKQVCDMLISKYTFLIYKFNSMGLFEYLPNISDEMRPEYRRYFIDLINSILKTDEGKKEECHCCE